jgi:site-specific recombinase XerD
MTTTVVPEPRVQPVAMPGGGRTFTVLGSDLVPIPAVEEFLEYLRAVGRSPNTVKSYARALALFWTFLGEAGRRWDEAGVEDLAAFLSWLRTGVPPGVALIGGGGPRVGEATVAVRLQAVASFYRYHQLGGAATADRLYQQVFGGHRSYKPFLEHVARRKGSRRSVVAPRRARPAPPPVLTPAQLRAIADACAVYDEAAGVWRGSVRDRLLWLLLTETGLRLGEALCLQHRDWHTGRGETAFVEVVAREHPHGLRVKGGHHRRVYISEELDRLYGEYVWALCEAGWDLAVADPDASYVFVNLAREPYFAPLRAETVYALVRRLRRQLAGVVPETFTPHWCRHTHATALLLAGVPLHVVTRRLGHADVQTTMNLYGHVTEDAELRAVADWRAWAGSWQTGAR